MPALTSGICRALRNKRLYAEKVIKETKRIRNLYRAKRFLAVLCVLLAGRCVVPSAFAQLDYDTYDIYQGGNIVGVIYVPQRGPDDRTILPVPATTATTAE